MRVRGQPHPENAGQVTGRQELFPDYSQEVIVGLRWRQREPGIPLKSKAKGASRFTHPATQYPPSSLPKSPTRSRRSVPPTPASSLAIEKASLEERARPEERRD